MDAGLSDIVLSNAKLFYMRSSDIYLSHFGHSHITSILLGVTTYLVFRTFYRIYFHPLSRIPGPKLAAATHLYEFYYDIVCGGRFLFQIEKLHKQYGDRKLNHIVEDMMANYFRPYHSYQST
jgi:hypothetical protein